MKPMIHIPVTALTALILCLTGCGPTDPVISIDFPFYFLQDIDVSGVPSDCCFLEAGDDGIAAADSLYFLDYFDGYTRAKVYLQGYPIEDVGATAEGGYALGLCGNLLFYVSDGTYTVHDPVPLSSYGRFILTNPTGGSWHLFSVGSDGTLTTINYSSWDVTDVTQVPGLTDPVGAVITSDGSAIFIADGGDDTVKKIATSNPGTVLAECDVPGGIADIYAGGGSLVYVAPDSISAIWGIDTGTGQHYSTYPLVAPAVSVAVTPDDHYIYAGFSGAGVSVINTQNLEVEASATEYGTPYDIAIDGSGHRALLCTSLGKFIVLRD